MVRCKHVSYLLYAKYLKNKVTQRSVKRSFCCFGEISQSKGKGRGHASGISLEQSEADDRMLELIEQFDYGWSDSCSFHHDLLWP